MSVPETETIHGMGGHRKVSQIVPVLYDKSAAMYVQTANGVNVTRRRGSAHWDVVSAEELAEKLRAKFPHIDANTLDRLHVAYPD